jgi:carbamate kinase
MVRPGPDRVLVALGGNAIAPEGRTDAPAQQEAVEGAMEQVAGLVAAGYDVVLTHGNGPQVGNLLVKNDLARDVVPPVPLDWCVAQTEATIGYLIVNALERSLAARSVERLIAVVVTRVLVAADDPAWASPSKPIGRHLSPLEAQGRVAAGETWQDRGESGWRRVVPSPEPGELLDLPMILRLLDDGAVVVAAGGGGIPMVRREDRLEGVEAVLDKDLTAAVLARAIGADCLVIATDVAAAAIHWGTSEEQTLGRLTPEALRAYADEGHFASGSMGPKVESAVRFVEQGGKRSVITSLEHLGPAVEGRVGTVIEREESYA